MAIYNYHKLQMIRAKAALAGSKDAEKGGRWETIAKHGIRAGSALTGVRVNNMLGCQQHTEVSKAAAHRI